MDNRYFHSYYKENFIKETTRDINELRNKASGKDNEIDTTSIQDMSLEDITDALEDGI